MSKKFKSLIPIFLILASIFFIYFLHMYYFHDPINQSKKWYQGYKDFIVDSAAIASNYNRVLVSNKLDQTLNFYLFYLNYDPKKFLEIDGGRVSGGFGENDNHLMNIFFKQDLSYEENKKNAKTLFVGTIQELGGAKNIIKEYKFLNGETSAVIAE